MKILLTGAGGFVGGHLLRTAIETFGHDNVVALTSRELDGVQSVVAKGHDLSQLGPDRFNDIDVLIHAGAFTPKSGQEANDIEACGRNISFTENLLRFQFASLKKVVFTSTLDVYAAAERISESTPLAPATLYGASKLYGEKMVEVFASQRSISHEILRLGHIYGPGEEAYQKILPLTISNILSGKPVQIWGGGEELRSFIYIEDIVSAILKAVTCDTGERVINIVGGAPISIKALVEKLVVISGRSVQVNHQAVSTRGRDFVFDNRLLKKTLLAEEYDFDRGLTAEFNHMLLKLQSVQDH
ncbi:NAD-dependent epimerase/dehydratase family protein [Pseudomonas tructae]|uniref:NAD-dependent epimerase/dehydratase family protein n=1 Tax=Pseudomonas tructae TaxID=2518644 RepID=A0A411MM73_9PSED|nr:NAD-dependent epimerase/dehydratase family protein [Pseudomonas tructae]QBF27924.1 NAD-dependent epimerase/dehydratase family protein [Pseudomonas tructae]